MAVITPSLPERSELLRECKDSVAAQTHPCEHLVGLDEKREGPQEVRNRLAWSTDADWVLPLDDDDTLDPLCVELLLGAADSSDVVYPWCRMEGRTDGWVTNKLYSASSLHKLNFIPCTALIRVDAFRMLGGYRKVPLEDWDLWRRAELHDLKFKCVPEVLWMYRFHGSNTYQGEAA